MEGRSLAKGFFYGVFVEGYEEVLWQGSMLYLALPGSLAFLVPRTFLALFFLSFLCFLVVASLVASPDCKFDEERDGSMMMSHGSKVAQQAYPDKTVLGLELLGDSEVVVDETEAGALATTELRLETEEEDGLRVLHLVHLGDLLLELSLGDVGTTLVNDIDDL